MVRPSISDATIGLTNPDTFFLMVAWAAVTIVDECEMI